MKVSEVLEKLNGDYNLSTLRKEIKISKDKLSQAFKNLDLQYNQSSRLWEFGGSENLLSREITDFVILSTNDTNIKTNENVGVRMSENKNLSLTNEEIKVLKSIVKERKSDSELVNKYAIYDELLKVPVGKDTERSAYNLSKTTTSRLKKYAKERRLPLQDLVELAIINLLDKYDKQ